jgi:rhamnogalacturonyl hydrolase YesR
MTLPVPGANQVDVVPPRAIARRLADVYGQRIDGRLMYTQGVAISGRLRLAELDATTAETSTAVAAVVAGCLRDPAAAFANDQGPSSQAGAVWAEEMFAATGDARYRDFLLHAASVFELEAQEAIAAPLDADVRAEDMFFASALLGRAFRLTQDERYARALSRFLLAADTQRPDRLFWHCNAARFCWGRGNGFAALGHAEALSYLPHDYPTRAQLVSRHVRHLVALRDAQDVSGMWRQVIDHPDAYLEHSGTTMITYAVARGIRSGWLDEAEWAPLLTRAWRGISGRIGPDAGLEQVCVGTGPMASEDEYLQRPFVDGRDDRGGAMALWCAVELARLES